MDIDPALFLDPNLKALFAQQVGAAVGDALEVKALESPDARFDPFHDSLDAGIDDILAGLMAMNDAIATGNLGVDAGAALQALGEANCTSWRPRGSTEHRSGPARSDADYRWYVEQRLRKRGAAFLNSHAP